MKHLLPDGRTLMASFADVEAFFSENAICGRTIFDVRPFALDYMIRNLGDLDDLEKSDTWSSITTDYQVCILFADGNHMEIEISGDGPIILGYNTADFSKYPQYDGSCYTLRTLFQHCIGKTIKEVDIGRSQEKMFFPCYKGIDMSEDDDGIKTIRLILDDGTWLSATGFLDFFVFSHEITQEECAMVPFSELLSEVTDEKAIYDFRW